MLGARDAHGASQTRVGAAGPRTRAVGASTWRFPLDAAPTGNEHPSAAARGLRRVTGRRRSDRGMQGLPSRGAGGRGGPLLSEAPGNPGAGVDGGGGELWEEPAGAGLGVWVWAGSLKFKV